MARLTLTISLLATLATGTALAAAEPVTWGSALTAARGPARVIGGPANGCVTGAAALPSDGPGFQAIRVSRNRHYGHPDTIAFVKRLGQSARGQGLEPFYVGDIAQPRGGPMSFGHAAHQNGLDVDIWFNLEPKPAVAAALRDEVHLPSMVLADKSAIDATRFGRKQVALLRLAGGDARVDRVFVHWTIKRALCDGVGGASEGDHSWLRRIRPWRGHDAHFHVRLSCPASSPDCVSQAPLPPGDGCDESLDWWFQPRPAAPVVAAPPPPPRPKLPEACKALLTAR